MLVIINNQLTMSIKEIKCQTVQEFWNKISPEQNLNGNFCYRGQSNSKWGLLPSAFRDNKANLIQKVSGISCGNASLEYISREVRIINIFLDHCDKTGILIPGYSSSARKKYLNMDKIEKIIVDQLCDEDPHNARWPNEDIDSIIAAVQHQGIPTRLLDWSTRSFIAAYFAASDAINQGVSPGQELSIWELNIDKISANKGVKIITVPGSTSDNLAFQSGLFTCNRQLYGDVDFKPIPLDEQIELNTVLKKITLPATYAREILNLCKIYGVTASTLFPNFEGVKRAVLDEINLMA
jgi:hypothetical protein